MTTQVQNAAAVGGTIAGSSETFQKALGTMSPLLTLVKPLFEVLGFDQFASGLGTLQGRVKDASDVLGSSNSIARANDWINDRKTISKKGWFSAKVVSQAAITGAHVIDTARFLAKVSLISLGSAGSYALRNVPVINWIHSGLVVTSASSGIIDKAQDRSRQSGEKARAVTHGQAWASKTDEDVRQLCRDRLADAALTAKHGKYQAYNDRLDQNRFQEVRDYKIQKYAVKELNSKKEMKKANLSIAGNIAKIAIVALGTLATSLLLTATLHWQLALAGVGLVAGGLGLLNSLVKTDRCAEMFGFKTQPIPMNPVASAA